MVRQRQEGLWKQKTWVWIWGRLSVTGCGSHGGFPDPFQSQFSVCKIRKMTFTSEVVVRIKSHNECLTFLNENLLWKYQAYIPILYLFNCLNGFLGRGRNFWTSKTFVLLEIPWMLGRQYWGEGCGRRRFRHPKDVNLNPSSSTC